MSTAKKNSVTRELIRRVIRIVSVSDGDVMAIKAGSPLARMDTIKRLSRAFAATHRSNVIVVVVDDFDNFTVIDEKKMNELGWYRKEVEEPL